jgi:FAD:protein FMN transferase
VSSDKPAEAPLTKSTPAARRRRLLLLGVAAGLPLAVWRAKDAVAAAPVRWQGLSMGAPASITLHHPDAALARAAVAAALAELARLESLFSLFRADSWLSRLNRAGHLNGAPAEFIELLQAALAMAQRSRGVFDPTVQPLWQLYFDHFVARGATDAPAAADVARAIARVDYRGVQIDGDRVTFARPGMGVTLNGIAQGYITDRCTDALRAHGFSRMLVDMGEPRAVAAKPDGTAWRLGLADPRSPTRALHTVTVVDRAVATSGGYGTRLDEAGRYTHLIDPRTARTAPVHESVTVIAPTATQADALSTALALIPAVEGRRALLRAQPGCRAICIDGAGRVSALEEIT